MNMLPLVSIITPCYNYGKFLSETLDSLLAQTYRNWECIIVNDGSTDNTEEIALRYKNSDNRFNYIYQRNKGLSNARNLALLHAKGKYIQLLDSDDLLEQDKLSLQIALLEDSPNIDLVYSSMLLFRSNAIKREFTSFNLSNNKKVSGKNEIIISALLEDNFFLPGCVMFRKAVYEQVGNFNEDLYGLEDWHYWFRAALLGFYFFYDDRINTRLLSRDHDSNMSKAKEKMLNARIKARTDVISIFNGLKRKNTLYISSKHFNDSLHKHNTYLNKDLHEYHFHFGSKIKAIKALLKYSWYTKNPFFPFYKAYMAISTRVNLKFG